jgi:hypothetical protein
MNSSIELVFFLACNFFALTGGACRFVSALVEGIGTPAAPATLGAMRTAQTKNIAASRQLVLMKVSCSSTAPDDLIFALGSCRSAWLVGDFAVDRALN